MGDENGRSTLEKLENFIDNENTLNSAATKIQALQRGRSDRANVKNQAKAATKIQALQRGRSDRANVKNQAKAATKIQALQEEEANLKR